MVCPLCERDCPERRMERHHLKTRRKDRFAVERVCGDCHRSVHSLFTNTELRDEARALDTVEGLLADPTFARHVAFVKRADPNGRVRTRTARTRGRRGR